MGGMQQTTQIARVLTDRTNLRRLACRGAARRSANLRSCAKSAELRAAERARSTRSVCPLRKPIDAISQGHAKFRIAKTKHRVVKRRA
jgi:hypothetical protein